MNIEVIVKQYEMKWNEEKARHEKGELKSETHGTLVHIKASIDEASVYTIIRASDGMLIEAFNDRYTDIFAS